LNRFLWDLRHAGGIDGFTALTSLLPRRGIGIAVLSNLNTNYAVGTVTLEAMDRLLDYPKTDWNQRFLSRVTAAVEAARQSRGAGGPATVPNTRPSHSLAEYAGQYENPGYGALSVAVEGWAG
jgi:hypothetical protein